MQITTYLQATVGKIAIGVNKYTAALYVGSSGKKKVNK